MARVGKDKQPRKHSGRPRKEAIVDKLTQKLEASKGVVFADYQGLTTKQTEDMKKALREANATFTVTKNSLLKLALSKSHFADMAKDVDLEKPTATLFMGEEVVLPLKTIAKAFKDFNLPKVKFGIIDGQALDEAGVLKLASLPPREVLLAQFIGTLNSPIQGLVVTLNATLSKFVMTLDAIAKQKPQEAPAQAAEAAPAPAAEPSTPSEEQPASEPVTEAASESPAEPAAQAKEESAQESTEQPEKPAEDNQSTTEGGDSNG